MKYCITIACSLLLLTAGLAFALDPTTNVFDPSVKGQDLGGPWNPQPNVGGETCATATVIPAVPYADGGTTCASLNDYAGTCVPNGAPDVVYRYTPTTNQCVNVSLCGSGYDTELLIFSGACGNEIGCNDDFCGLQSEIDGVNLTAGTTYYFVVDGYASNCGTYTLNISLCPQCPPCPPARQLEGEPDCGPGYIDAYNGGCNSTPNVVTTVACNTICGKAGTYIAPNGLSYRDTDWYQLTTTGSGTGTVTVVGNLSLQLAVLLPTCNPITLTCGSVFASPCVPASCTFSCGTTVWVFVAPSVFSGVPCSSTYLLTFSGCGVPQCPGTATENTSWGKLKGLYQ